MGDYDKANALFEIAGRWNKFIDKENEKRLAEIPTCFDEAVEKLGEIAFLCYHDDPTGAVWVEEIFKPNNEMHFVISAGQAIGAWVQKVWGLSGFLGRTKEGPVYEYFTLQGISDPIEMTNILFASLYRKHQDLPEDIDQQIEDARARTPCFYHT